MADDLVLEALETAVTAASAARDAYLARSVDGHLVPLGTAAARWRVSYDTALKRAQRGAAVKRNGRWYVSASAL